MGPRYKPSTPVDVTTSLSLFLFGRLMKTIDALSLSLRVLCFDCMHRTKKQISSSQKLSQTHTRHSLFSLFLSEKLWVCIFFFWLIFCTWPQHVHSFGVRKEKNIGITRQIISFYFALCKHFLALVSLISVTFLSFTDQQCTDTHCFFLDLLQLPLMAVSCFCISNIDAGMLYLCS